MNHTGTETQRDELSQAVIGCGIEVQRHSGPGLLESAYETCLAWELEQRELKVERQKSLPVVDKGQSLDVGDRVDLIVDGKLLIELKTVDKIEPVHQAQLLPYLKPTGLRVGLLMNFNAATLREGIQRMVH